MPLSNMLPNYFFQLFECPGLRRLVGKECTVNVLGRVLARSPNNHPAVFFVPLQDRPWTYAKLLPNLDRN
jgi:hypothetical protein